MTCGTHPKHLAVLLMAVCISMGGVIVAPAEEPVAQKYDFPIKKHEANIQKLQSGIEIHLGKLQISGEQEFNLLDEIERIDKELALQKVRIAVMKDRLDSQRELLTIKIRDLQDAKQKKEEMSKHLRERLRAFYLMGKTGVLNVTFSTRTLPDLMLFNDSFTRLLEYDQKIIEQYRNTIDQLVFAKEAHARESELLGKYIADALAEQQTLDSLLNEKTKMLHKVKTQKGLYEQALVEMKKAEAELQNSLVDLRKKQNYSVKGFVIRKGTLHPPVNGRLVSRFGEKKEGADKGMNRADGITIEARNGEPVKAVFSGKVIFAGYKRGYGNMIILDHGLNYFSITSRIEKITVKEDKIVKEGDIIGIAGDIATLFEPGLYFEIRHDTKPVDPLEWLSSEGLTGMETASGQKE